MYFFHNDYNEICHPNVLKKMQELNNIPMNGYGEDECCKRAADKIRQLCRKDSLSVHFISGGTQTNLTVIAASLRPHQAVLSASSGHIQSHETGAIEATGHKVLPLFSADGKITADQIACTAEDHLHDPTFEHIPQPKMVYISQPTELGTMYTLSELEEISSVCRKYGYYLFVDGARLGYALAAKGNDLYLPDLARLTDVFYIGGTKVGAMFGEAVVISNPLLQADFRYLMKQRGAMLAKGWILGLQFDALLEDDLYTKISTHADQLADQIRSAICDAGYPMPIPTTANQIFAILPTDVCREIEKDFTFSPWEKVDENHMLVRFCTSWASTRQGVDALCKELKKYANIHN